MDAVPFSNFVGRGRKNNRAVCIFQSADDPVGDHLPAAVLEIDRRLPHKSGRQT
jgi:hypothetical protein